MMEGTRQQKVAKQIQKDLSEIFQKDKWGIFYKKLVSIAEVRVTADLSLAKVYLSMMMVENKDLMLEKIEDHKSEIRKLLGNRVGKQMRKVPELAFFKDEVEERASRIDKLIDSLNIPPAQDDDEQRD